LKKTSRQGPTKAIGDLLAGVLGRSKTGRVVAREVLQRAWVDAVGSEVANETRVRGYREGVLTVEVENAALLQELSTFYRAELMRSLRVSREGFFVELRDLRFRLV
jgi:hypothetical protein